MFDGRTMGLSDYRKLSGSMYTHLHDYSVVKLMDSRSRIPYNYKRVQAYVTGVGNVPVDMPKDDCNNPAAYVVSSLRARLVFPFAIQAYSDGGIVRIVKRHGDKSIVASVFIPKQI